MFGLFATRRGVERSTRLRAIVAAAVLSGSIAALPGLAGADDMSPFLGRWDAASDDCSYPNGDGVFVIERQRIRYYEAICAIESVRSAGIGAAVIIERNCEGEGDTWRDQTMLVPLDQNKIALYEAVGGGFTASRCSK